MLGCHDAISTTISFAGDYSDFRHRGFTIGIEQFCPVFNNPAEFLRRTRQKARHINKGQDRDIETVTKANKTRRLARSIGVKTARQYHGLIADNADSLAFEADKPGQDITGKILLDFKEIALIRDLRDQLVHVIGNVGIFGHEGVEAVVNPVGFVKERPNGRACTVIERQEIKQAADLGDRFHVIVKCTVRDRRFGGVGLGAPKFFGSDHFVRHSPDHIRPCQEHVGGIPHHENEISQRRGINRPACTRSHDDRDLWNNARGEDIILEYIRVPGQCRDAFLDTRTTAVIEPDHWCSLFDRHFLHLADFAGMSLGERAAKDSKILREHKGLAAIDRAPPGHNTITGHGLRFHAKVIASMSNEHVELFKRVFIQQKTNAFAGRQLALVVLRSNTLFSTAEPCLRASVFEFFENVFHIHPLPEAQILTQTHTKKTKKCFHKRRLHICNPANVSHMYEPLCYNNPLAIFVHAPRVRAEFTDCSNMQIKRSYLIAAVLLVLIFLWFAIKNAGDREDVHANGTNTATTQADEVPTVAIDSISIETHVRYFNLHGQTAPVREVAVKAETAGLVIKTPVREGSYVRRGTLLCQQDIDARQAAFDQARATLYSRELDYKAAQTLVNKGYRSETQALAAQAALDGARAAVKQAEIELGNVNMRAPFSGVFDQQMAEIGEYLGPGQPCGLLIDLDPILVNAEATEAQISAIRIGEIADIRLATGETVQGKVRFIETKANPATRTFTVEFEVPNTNRSIRAGVTANIRLAAGEMQAHLIPSNVLAIDDIGRVGVRILDYDRTVRFLPVDTIDESDIGVWVTGLPDQTDLIIRGQDYVREGTKVRTQYDAPDDFGSDR